MNFFTEIAEGVSISWSAIRANKMRSVLTTLGIIIGIVTVTLMGTAIEGLNRSFMQSVSSIGADVLYVQRMDWIINSYEAWINMSKRRQFTLAQANSAMRTIDFASAMAPMANSSACGENLALQLGLLHRSRSPFSVSLLTGCSTEPPSADAQAQLSTDSHAAFTDMTNADSSLQSFVNGGYAYVIFPSVGKGSVEARIGTRPVFLDDPARATICPVYRRDRLGADARLEGPCIIEEFASTTVVFPGDKVALAPTGEIIVTLRQG